MRRVAIAAAVVIALAAPATVFAKSAGTTVFVPATAADNFGSGGPAVATGVVLHPGDKLVLTATGLASCSGGACFLDANGSGGSADGSFLAPGTPLFSLVGRVGTSGPWIFIGVGPTIVTGDGELFLAYNDNFYPDNVGGWTVTIGHAATTPESTPSAPTVSYCAPTSRGWTFLQISTPGQLEAGFWHDAIADKSTVLLAGQVITFTGEAPVLAALVPHVGLTCDQPWFVNGTYADPRYALRGADWDAAFPDA